MHLLILNTLFAACCVAFAAVLESADAVNATAVAVVNAAETLIALGGPCSVPGNTAKVSIRATVVLTPGTSTTAVTLRIYRGTTSAGTLVSTATAQAGNFTVGSPASFVIAATDALTSAAFAQYCVTAQQTGGAANGTVGSVQLETMVLSG